MRKVRSKLLTISGLCIYVVIVMLPPILYGYVYPNIGDDTAVYLSIFDRMAQGDRVVAYLGYSLVGYPLISASQITGISTDALFLWFNYVVFALVGLVIYFVVSHLVNRKAGWLALVLSVFVTQGLMFLYYYGQIFNIINIGIILPLLLYVVVRYADEKQWWQLALLIVLVALFSTFHTNGIYLPAIVGFAVLAYLVYSRVKKRTIKKSLIFVGVGIVFASIALFALLVLLPSIEVLERVPNWDNSALITNIGKGMMVPIGHYVMDILSPMVLLLVALCAVYFSEIKKSMGGNTKLFVFLLACAVVVLGLSAFAKLSLDPWRQALDFATMFALLVAVCIGVILSQQKGLVVWAIVVVLIGFGLYHNLPTWFGYNSSITKADMQAIEYMNGLGVKTYSCSSQVAYWVYDRYTDVTHWDNGGDVVLVRNKPMTPRSTEGNLWYQKHGWLPSNEYEYVVSFKDRGIGVNVYKLADWARQSREEAIDKVLRGQG